MAEGDWEKAASEFAGMWVYGTTRSPHQPPLVLRGRFETTIADTLRRTEGSGWTATEVGAAERLTDMRVPSTVVTGGRDSRVIRDMAEAIAAASPQHRLLTVPDAGHLLNLEAVAAFNQIVLSCLAEARSP